MWTKHVTESGLPAEMFDQFTPGMAAMTIAMLEMQKLGLEPDAGVDKHFFALARKAGGMPKVTRHRARRMRQLDETCARNTCGELRLRTRF